MAGGKAAAKKLELAERRQTALSLRKSGASFRAIAAHISTIPGNEGYSEGRAHADVSACLKEINEKTSLDTEEYRSLELERLDTAQLAIAKKVQAGDLGAIDRWLRLSERRSKLLGLDAPVKVDIAEHVQTELEAFLDSLETLLPSETYRQVLTVVTAAQTHAAAASRN